MEIPVFFVVETFGDGLSEELIKLLSQLIQLSSQTGDLLGRLRADSFFCGFVLLILSFKLEKFIFELVKDLRFCSELFCLLPSFLRVLIVAFLLFFYLAFERLF